MKQSSIIKAAQQMDCASFYNKYEKDLEWDAVENLSDYNEGMVNLIYHGTGTAIVILFIDGKFEQCS